MGFQREMIGQQIIDLDDYKNTYNFIDYYHSYGNRGYQERPLWSPIRTPPFINGTDGYQFQIMNIPIFTKMANTTFDDLKVKTVFIQMENSNDHALIDQLAS